MLPSSEVRHKSDGCLLFTRTEFFSFLYAHMSLKLKRPTAVCITFSFTSSHEPNILDSGVFMSRLHLHISMGLCAAIVSTLGWTSLHVSRSSRCILRQCPHDCMHGSSDQTLLRSDCSNRTSLWSSTRQFSSRATKNKTLEIPDHWLMGIEVHCRNAIGPEHQSCMPPFPHEWFQAALPPELSYTSMLGVLLKPASSLLSFDAAMTRYTRSLTGLEAALS